MKKLYVVIIALLLVGCSNAKEIVKPEVTYNFNYNGQYYRIYTPYKPGVGENYFLTDAFNNYNLNEIEKGLLDISSEHFPVDQYRYQEGQYLTKKDLTDLLSAEKLNKASTITADGVQIKPKYISAIYEENFLDDNGNLKGISLGIVVNRYQAYKVGGKQAYYTVSEEKTVDHVKSQIESLVTFIRSKKGVYEADIIIGIYVESSPNSTVSGSYRSYGLVNGSAIEWKATKQNKHYINSAQAKKIDVEAYNNFQTMENKIKREVSDLYIAGMGYYQSDKLTRAEIKITRNNYRYGELLYLTNIVSENLIKYFNNVEVAVEFRENNNVKAYILKSKGKQSTDIFIY